jgi:hypothetical protein
MTQKGERSKPLMLTITSLIIVLSLLFGGTGAAVLVAQDSLPGDALYMVKTAGEDAQFRLTVGPETKLELALKFANRRIAEASAFAEKGKVYTQQEIKEIEELLADSLKDALLAAMAMDDPAVGLSKLRTHVFMWEEDYKRLQDGMPIDAPAHQVRNVIRNMRILLDGAVENPLQFKAEFQSRFGMKLQELDLLATAVVEDSLPVEEPVVEEKAGQHIKAGEEKGYGPGPEEAQFAPKNGGDETPFEFKGGDGETGGPGSGEPSGSGSGNQNQGSSGNQNQSGKQP